MTGALTLMTGAVVFDFTFRVTVVEFPAASVATTVIVFAPAVRLTGCEKSPFSATVAGMGQGFGIPSPLAVIAILTEFLAPLALLLGLGTRIAAAGIVVLMGVAASFHLPNGFFMNWLGSQAGEGYEFHILAIAMALALVLGGGGALALDRSISAHTTEPGEIPVTRLRRAA